MSTFYGTNNWEFLSARNWNYDWSTFHMNGGDDVVNAPLQSTTYYLMYGGSGHDYLYGARGSDILYGDTGLDFLAGRDGNDYLYGGVGNDRLNGGGDHDRLTGGSGTDTLLGLDGRDYLDGGSDSDTLDGGADNDILFGNTGKDTLTGGAGSDTFVYKYATSPGTSLGADVIQDWNVAQDWIDSSIRGTSSNYAEVATHFTSITEARHWAEDQSSLRGKDHVFLYNAQTDTGYLVSDLGGDSRFDTGVILKGAGSAWDMSYSDII